MNRQQHTKNLSENLASLAESFDSIADFCRKVGVNRQQFNKYLAGQHIPSQKILLKIGRYFSMEPDHFFLPNPDFVKFYEGQEHEIPVDLRSFPEFMRFLPLALSSSQQIKPFYGVYHRYHNSSIYKGRILRSITCIYERDSVSQYVTIERFPKLDGSGKTGCTFTYHGFCFLLGDRIFMVDFEGDQKNEMTFSTLVPQFRNPVRFLYGVVSGVAATTYRQPFSTRMILEFSEKGKIKKKHLRSATALLQSDLSIPLEVREYLSGDHYEIIWGGEG